MIGEKRKRGSAPLPPMTIVTRSSARRQSLDSTASKVAKTSAHETRSTRSAAANKQKTAGNSANNGSSRRTRAVYNQSANGLALPQHVVDQDDNDIIASSGFDGGAAVYDIESSSVPSAKRQCLTFDTQNKVDAASVVQPPQLQPDEQSDYDEDDYEDEEEEEEEDEELPHFEYESKYKDEMDEVEMVSKDVESLAHSLPLVANLDPIAENKLSNFDQLFVSALGCEDQTGPRWPIDKQDESTSFSILTNPRPSSSKSTASNTINKLAFSRISSKDSASFTTPLHSYQTLDDFVNYESAGSLTDDDSSSISSGSSSPILQPYERNIPLCGYRDRNNAHKHGALTLPPPEPHKPAKYYQQALVAATGLNRRSLWSGKAREMVGVGAPPQFDDLIL